MAVSWCPKDSALLLSAGKDCKILCWNPSSGEMVNEVFERGCADAFNLACSSRHTTSGFTT